MFALNRYLSYVIGDTCIDLRAKPDIIFGRKLKRE